MVTFGHVVCVQKSREVSSESRASLLLRNSFAGLRKVNLTHFVSIEVHISWQTRHFVSPEVQVVWQAQHFVLLEVQMAWHMLRMCSDMCALMHVLFKCARMRVPPDESHICALTSHMRSLDL